MGARTCARTRSSAAAPCANKPHLESLHRSPQGHAPKPDLAVAARRGTRDQGARAPVRASRDRVGRRAPGTTGSCGAPGPRPARGWRRGAPPRPVAPAACPRTRPAPRPGPACSRGPPASAPRCTGLGPCMLDRASASSSAVATRPVDHALSALSCCMRTPRHTLITQTLRQELSGFKKPFSLQRLLSVAPVLGPHRGAGRTRGGCGGRASSCQAG